MNVRPNPLNFLSWLSLTESRKASSSKSVMLCDEIFHALDHKLPHLHIKHEHNWCSIWDTGPIIAWVSHGTFGGSIKIWFIGNYENARRLSALMGNGIKLIPIDGTLGDCSGSFKISDASQIPQTVEFLSRLIAASRASRETC